MNRRVAQHQGRKGKAAYCKEAAADALRAETGSTKTTPTQAAARVAERYAKALSYSEMIALEARAAMRGAAAAMDIVAQTPEAPMGELAAPVFALPELAMGLPNPSLAEVALAGHEANSGSSSALDYTSNIQVAEPALPVAAKPEPAKLHTHQPIFKRAIDLPPAKPATSERPFEIRWDADLPVREAVLAYSRNSREDTIYEVDAAAVSRHRLGVREAFDLPEVVEPAQPIHANLIHFPRELVAAQKARPRRAEGQIATLDEVQLSIFEAELGVSKAVAHAANSGVKVAAPAWAGIDLPAVKLPQEPTPDTPRSSPPSARIQGLEPVQQLGAHVAPLNRRILAGIVDFSLVTGAFLTGALVGTLNATVLPPLKEMELGSLVALALIAVFYQALFFGLSRATPGMQYAGLELCTFTGKRPRMTQRLARAAAMVVSLLPFGLGAAWALFDDQQLSWHDRLSSTYLRKA